MKKIKDFRKARKLTQAELAQMLNISQSAISQWEKGLTNPGLPILIELAKIFECTVDDLLRE